MRQFMISVVALLVLGGTLSAQDDWRKVLAQNLEAAYRTTSAPGRDDTVTSPGVVLVVGKGGVLTGNRMDTRGALVTRIFHRNVQSSAGQGAYTFKAGDRVYVQSIEVGEESVTFQVFGADAATRFKADVRLGFEEGSLETAEVVHIAEELESLLTIAK